MKCIKLIKLHKQVQTYTARHVTYNRKQNNTILTRVGEYRRKKKNLEKDKGSNATEKSRVAPYALSLHASIHKARRGGREESLVTSASPLYR